MSYYKSNHPDVLLALACQAEREREMEAQGRALADKFGGTPLYENNAHGRKFAGLRFGHPGKDKTLWTAPDEHFRQRPRSFDRLAKKDPNRALLERLHENWKAAWPTVAVDYAPMWQALGTDWGNVLMNGCSRFEYDGTLYLRTDAVLDPKAATEILGSEYKAAETRFRNREKADAAG